MPQARTEVAPGNAGREFDGAVTGRAPDPARHRTTMMAKHENEEVPRKIMDDNSNTTSGVGAAPNRQSQESSASNGSLPSLTNVREVVIADIIIPPERKADPD